MPMSNVMMQQWTPWLRIPIFYPFRNYSVKQLTSFRPTRKGSGRVLFGYSSSMINLWLICNYTKITIIVLLQISHSTDIEKKYPRDTLPFPFQYPVYISISSVSPKLKIRTLSNFKPELKIRNPSNFNFFLLRFVIISAFCFPWYYWLLQKSIGEITHFLVSNISVNLRIDNSIEMVELYLQLESCDKRDKTTFWIFQASIFNVGSWGTDWANWIHWYRAFSSFTAK